MIRQSDPAPTNGKEVGRLQTVTLVLFTWLGVSVSYSLRQFPSGFYLKFLHDNQFNKTIGTIMVSTFMLTMTISPYLLRRLTWLHNKSVKVRCLLYAVLSTLSTLVLTMVDKAVGWDSSGSVVFVLIGIIRSIQGGLAGALFIFFQGEMTDVYFKGNKLVTGIISSGIHAGGIVGIITAGQLYDQGGWELMSPVIAGVMLLPLIFLPFVKDPNPVAPAGEQQDKYVVENKIACHNREESGKIDAKLSTDGGDEKPEIPGVENEKMDIGDEKVTVLRSLTKLQTVAYYMPDMVVFLDNITFLMLIYVLPDRMVNFNNMSLSRAVVVLNLINLNSFIFTIVFSFLINKRINTLLVILVGTLFFYTGAIMMYGSTTEFLSFSYAFEIGSLLTGIGDAAIVNLCIPSKYALFEKWNIGLEKIDLGVEASTTFNLVMGISAAFGVVMSSFTSTRSSEMPTITYAVIVFVVSSGGIVISKFI